MAYCALTDILDSVDEDVLIRLTTDAGDAVDTGKVDAAIAHADAEINGYCGSRYNVPMSPVPAIIGKFSVDIAAYNLYALRDDIPDDRAKRYDNAIRFLAMVARGKISLGVDDPDGTPAPDNRPEIVSDGRLFSRDSLKGF